MNDTQRHNPNSTPNDAIDWQSLPKAAQLRALADGELPAEVEAELRKAMGDDAVAQALAVETTLRKRCSACMSDASLPEGLRDQVLDALADDNEQVISRTEQGFWAGGGRALLGIAAAIALAATVWILSATGTDPAEQFLQQATQHITGEHGGCEIDEKFFEAKIAQHDLNAGPEAFIAEQIGDLPVHLELDESEYRLAGVGRCHIPGPGKSVHLLYEPIDATAAHGPVSLFIQDATDAKQALKEGVVYTNGFDTKPYLRIWREGKVVYYMATSCPVGCDMVESAYALTGEKIPL